MANIIAGMIMAIYMSNQDLKMVFKIQLQLFGIGMERNQISLQ